MTMMARPDGSGVEAPIVAMNRPRGARLDDDEVRCLRDLVYCLLVDTLALSAADARRVLAAGRVDPSQLCRRRKRLPPAVDQLGALRMMAAVAAGATDRDTG